VWEDCSLETQWAKIEKLFKIKTKKYKGDEDISKKAKIKLKALNIPLKKCYKYKTLFDWKECKLEDIKNSYPDIDLEEIYERVDECEGQASF
jgi:hypothetical protein